MKLNIGCGFNKLDGYINVDSFSDCGPDLVWDLEQTPWPYETSSVDEIYASHVLEHLGHAPDTFLSILKEIYRVLRHEGRIIVRVPHHLHSTFYSDPTHVRAFTVNTFDMLSRQKNLEWSKKGVNVTMLALMLNVDFEVETAFHNFDEKWRAKIRSGELTREEVSELSEQRPGVVRELVVRMRAIKQPNPE